MAILSKPKLEELFLIALSEMFREPVLTEQAPKSIDQLLRAIKNANSQYESEFIAKEELKPTQVRLKINAQAAIIAYLEQEAYEYYNKNVGKEGNVNTYLDVFQMNSGTTENIDYHIADYVKKCKASGDELFVQWVKGIFITADAALTKSDGGELERERRIDDLFRPEESHEHVAGMSRP